MRCLAWPRASPNRNPVSCSGKKPLGMTHVEISGEHDQRDRAGQHERLMAEDPAQAAVVAVPHPFEDGSRTARLIRPGRSLVFAGKEQRAHHRRQRQRDEGRGYDGDAHRHRKFMKQPADDAGHEQQRNEHGNQGERDRDDGEADLARADQCGLESRICRPRCSGRCFRSSRWRRRPRSRLRWSAP